MNKKWHFLIVFVLLLISAFILKTSFGKINNSVSDLNESISDKAIKVANENGFIAKDLEVDEGNILEKTETPNKLNSKMTIRIKSCSLNKTMHLDPETFKVLKFENEIWCGGIPGN